MTASFEDGVLSITVPKVPEKKPDVVDVPIGHNHGRKADKKAAKKDAEKAKKDAEKK